MTTWIASALILIACFARIVPHLASMPIVALAPLTAAYLPDKRSAFLVFFGGLLVSDLVRGLYAMIPVVYAGLVPVLLIGFQLRKKLNVAPIAAATLSGSLIYFFLTNFGVWILGGCDWTQAREYPLTFAGLVDAFSVALPGLPRKMLADLVAALLFFAAVPLMHERLARIFDLTALRSNEHPG
jgi:hypothetical protein